MTGPQGGARTQPPTPTLTTAEISVRKPAPETREFGRPRRLGQAKEAAKPRRREGPSASHPSDRTPRGGPGLSRGSGGSRTQPPTPTITTAEISVRKPAPETREFGRPRRWGQAKEAAQPRRREGPCASTPSDRTPRGGWPRLRRGSGGSRDPHTKNTRCCAQTCARSRLGGGPGASRQSQSGSRPWPAPRRAEGSSRFCPPGEPAGGGPSLTGPQGGRETPIKN